MERLSVREIISASHARLLSGNINKNIYAVAIDTRKIRKNSLYIALKGKRYDGHAFASQALEKGACGIIVNRAALKRYKIKTQKIVLEVNDTLQALQDIAHYYRNKFSLQVIGITGTNGKTTTKDILRRLLSSRFNVLSTQGNMNNQIGVPLMLLRLTSKHQYAVLEIGTNMPGEVKKLCRMASPTVGLITNIGAAHLEGLKTLHGVAREKTALFDSLPANGLAVVNADDRYLHKNLSKLRCRIHTFAIENDAATRAENICISARKKTSFLLCINNEQQRCATSLKGTGNIYNILAASTVAYHFGLSLREICDSVASFAGSPDRLEIISLNGKILINDVYNANPASMKMAIQTLVNIGSKRRKIVVAGDMLELGKHSRKLHMDMGKYIAKSKVDLLFTLGKSARLIGKSAVQYGFIKRNVFFYNNMNRLVDKLLKIISQDDALLVKGSRAMGMERIVQALSS